MSEIQNVPNTTHAECGSCHAPIKVGRVGFVEYDDSRITELEEALRPLVKDPVKRQPLVHGELSRLCCDSPRPHPFGETMRTTPIEMLDQI